MKTAANVVQIEAEPQAETNIALLMETDPGIVIRETAKWEALRERIKSDIAAQVPDLTTKKGQDAIRKLAADVTRTKTAVDRARKQMTEEFRLKTAEVNKVGGEIVDNLDSLAELARRPLTEWEDAEKKRTVFVDSELTRLRSASTVLASETSAQIAERLALLQSEEFNKAIFCDDWDEADRLKQVAVVRLEEAHARLLKEESDKAELDQLRAERAKREWADKILQHIKNARMGFIDGQPYPYVIIVRELEEKICAEDVDPEYRDQIEVARMEALQFVRQVHQESERTREEQRQAEQQQLQQEAAQRAADEAAARVQREAEEALVEERRKHQAELDRIERDRKAEADTLAAEQKRKDDEALRQKQEDERRAANVAHRSKIMGAAKEALMTVAGLDEETARKVVRVISAGSIPNTTIAF